MNIPQVRALFGVTAAQTVLSVKRKDDIVGSKFATIHRWFVLPLYALSDVDGDGQGIGLFPAFSDNAVPLIPCEH